MSQGSITLLALVLGLLLVRQGDAYQGFDCGQGTAMMYLAAHSQCGSAAHMACFKSLAMRVRKCSIKAWPHHFNTNHRPCWGLQLMATVLDVNQANGSLTVPMHGSGRHVSMPVSLHFSRPEESMLVRSGPSCVMRFQVETVPGDALYPVPGEGGKSMSSVVLLLVPALLVPCLCVGLIMALGRLAPVVGSGLGGRTAGAGGSGAAGHSSSSSSFGATVSYRQLPGGPRYNSSSSSSSGGSHAVGGGSYGCGPGGPDHRICSTLFTKTFNLKAMSRRARARRMRRHIRPVYVGPGGAPGAAGPASGQPLGLVGQVKPGGVSLVAPYFKFPPVAVPPGLPAIPEAVTPRSSSSSSAAPSRTSSANDLEQDLLAAAAAAVMQQQGCAPLIGDANDSWEWGGSGAAAAAAGHADPGSSRATSGQLDWVSSQQGQGGSQFTSSRSKDHTSSSSSSLPSARHDWSNRVQQHQLLQQRLSQQFFSSLQGPVAAAGGRDCGDQLLLGGAWFQQQQLQQQQQLEQVGGGRGSLRQGFFRR